ncbi:carbon-nitrogen hydrolase family protein [Sporolactobacillus shoreae]|uniref:carbon-nitrogen hydrolase family protein n=1 Tax=Sporolactobacillus shoreae TaxID=1465501 RepID=UPI001433478C|nr:carbon-nitrogen hydrolase family protein [Sporolactobacillus shoreae]
MEKLTIGTVQIDCNMENKEDNIQKVEKILDHYGPKTDILCFPELFTTGYHLEQIDQNKFYELAEEIPGPTVTRLSQKAKEYHTAIVGSIVEKDRDLQAVLYDTAFVINEKGEYVGKYRKAHLYPTEHQYFRSGSSFPIFKVFGIPVGVAICYDHAFLEQFRILALKGAQIIFIPSVIPKNYEYLLDLRTRARAQDNQVFTVASNRVGQEGGIIYCGRSKIVNPKGEIVSEGNDQESVVTGLIALGEIDSERKQEPVFRNRRPELYQLLSQTEANS